MPTATFANLPLEKRTRVIDAAVREFASHRYADASLDRVAATASIAKGSLYQYFENKADLYRHVVFEELGRRKLAVIDASLDPEGTYLERLESTCFAGLSLFSRDVEAAAVAVRLLESQSDADVRELHDLAREAGVVHARAELVRARTRGELREGVDLDVAARLVAHVTGAALVDVLLTRVGSIDDLVRAHANVDEAVVRDSVRRVIRFVGEGLVTSRRRRAR